MRVLRSRLYEIAREEADTARARIRKDLIKSGDRSEKVRTYNFPQNRVTDHRIGLSLYNLSVFLAGEIDEMVDSLEKSEREERLQSLSIEIQSQSASDKTSPGAS
jgi:peptide chain release factor 1